MRVTNSAAVPVIVVTPVAVIKPVVAASIIFSAPAVTVESPTVIV